MRKMSVNKGKTSILLFESHKSIERLQNRSQTKTEGNTSTIREKKNETTEKLKCNTNKSQ